MQVRKRIRCCTAAAVCCLLQSLSISVAADDGYHRKLDEDGDATEGRGSFAPDRRDAHPLLAGHATRRRAVADAGGSRSSATCCRPSTCPRQGQRHPSRQGSSRRAASSRTTSGSSTW